MTTTHTEKLSSTKVSLTAKGSNTPVAWEVTTFKGGKTEIYREYSDSPGLMQFLGYYDELCLSAAGTKLSETIQPTVVRHLEAHRAYWKSFLPGAATWLHAA